MTKLDVKFTRSTKVALCLSYLIWCTSTLATPACHDVHQGGNPIAEQRFSSTFLSANQSSCQSGSPEYYVTNAELYQEIQFSEATDFCPSQIDENSVEEERVCGPDNLFRFSEHSERLPLFIQQSSSFLSNISLPASFNENALSDEEKLHYQAIIYFCTRSFSESLIDKINSRTLPIEERLSAFLELKQAGLLHMFSTDALRLVIDPDLDRQFKKQILFGFLNEEALASQFVGLIQKSLRTVEQITERSQGQELSPRMTQELRKHQSILSSLQEIFTEFVEAEHRPEQLQALHLLAGVNIPGADSAVLILERRIQASIQAQPEAPPITSVAASPTHQPQEVAPAALYSQPECIEESFTPISNEDYIVVEQLVFNNNSDITRQSIDFSQDFITQYNSQLKWTSLILSDPSKQSQFESFYCHQLTIQNALANLSELDNEEADRIFQLISSIPDSISNLGSLATLLPALSRSEYIRALELIGTSSNNILEVDEFKAQVLFDEFQRITSNGTNLLDIELTNAILAALGRNSGFAADQKLSEIFQSTSNESLRMTIIQTYSNPAFARFGSRLNIFHTLFEFPPEQRRPYAQALARIVQENYSSLQASGGANNSSGSLAATEGQVSAALAAVMALNSDRTGNLNDGLEEVLTSDGEAQIHSRRAPIARQQTTILNIEDPNIREQSEATIVAANTVSNNLTSGASNHNPFDAFNQIIEGQNRANQPVNNDFIPDANYLARGTGERRQNDKVGTVNEDQEMNEAPSTSGVDRTAPNKYNRTNNDNDNSASVDPIASDNQPRAESSQNERSPASRTAYADTAVNVFKNQAKSLDDQSSQLIKSIRKDEFESGRLTNTDNNLRNINSQGMGSRSPSSQSSASRSIASTSAPSVRAVLPASENSTGTSVPKSNTAEKERDTTAQAPSEPLLTPRQQINRNERGRVIVIKDNEQKLKFLNYMSVKNQFSCDELLFIKTFYKDNLSYFFTNTVNKETTQFANVEIDQMTYKFDYPGDIFITEAEPKACSPRAPASPAAKENNKKEASPQNEVEAPPERRQSIQDLLFNKFKEKFGL